MFGLHRDTVRKMLAYSVPPGYRRQDPPRRPKLEPFTGVIDGILEADRQVPRKQRHTAKRKRLRGESYRPLPFVRLIISLRKVRWMFAVEMYARVRRACMVEGMSVREASRVFGLHRGGGHGAQDAGLLGTAREALPAPGPTPPSQA